MFYQIQNISKTKSNQIAVTSKSKIFTAIKAAGWVASECKIIALDDSLKNTFTKIKTGNRNKRGRQFAMRAGV
jgi:endonuclease III-like uncharacterized protein